MKDNDLGKRKLRTGVTTGSCAAAAAKAAVLMLLTGQSRSSVHIETPKGVELTLPVRDVEIREGRVSCAVPKDSGDDPDITNGIMVCATVEKTGRESISITGGEGIGIVTKPGLACPVGEAAINPVPRQMIFAETRNVCRNLNYSGGLAIRISVPGGEKIAQKTFNPRLGIEGGISILGTTGIVEPMSEKAWIDTIYLEMKVHRAGGSENLLVCPGNYGQNFIRASLGINPAKAIKCSNYLGEMLDFARELDFGNLLLIGHAGKLVKLAAGIMNTHSRHADARMEILAAHAALQGAGTEQVKHLMTCNTTEEAAAYLIAQGLSGQVFPSVMKKIAEHVQNRVQGSLKTAVILFTNEHGILGKTEGADDILMKMKETGRV